MEINKMFGSRPLKPNLVGNIKKNQRHIRDLLDFCVNKLNK
jgi:hypothetical protein